MKRIAVGVVGATGTVGQRLIHLLEEHPWFELREVGASDRSAGHPLGDRWSSDEGIPISAEAARFELKTVAEKWNSPLILSALPSSAAKDAEERFAQGGHLVVSNASAFRMDPEVPLLIPEINPDHLELLSLQKERWDGGIVTNPNCAVAGLATALAPLHRAFGIEKVVATTFQSISGAGRPGPPAGTMTDNVVPFIPGEEEKLASEPQKILGKLSEAGLIPADFAVSAAAVRVPVTHGHLVSASVGFHDEIGAQKVEEVFRTFRHDLEGESLPSMPRSLIQVLSDDDRPQPRLDRNLGEGMTVTVGRIRRCESLHVKFLVLSHNLYRGAAGAALLNAELCHLRGVSERSALGDESSV